MQIKVVRKITTVRTYSETINYSLINGNADRLDEDLPLIDQDVVNDTTEFYDVNGKCIDLIALEEFYDQL